jgi:hypothetical protein
MKLEITVDESILQELVLPSLGNVERTNMSNRIERHTLVGSAMLRQEWLNLLEKDFFQRNPSLREYIENWLTNIMTDKTRYKSVTADPEKVKGNPSPREQAVLEAAYESECKIVVGDYSGELRRANPQLRFVSRNSFAKAPSTMITMKQVQDVLDGPSNLKNDLFAVFETPVQLIVNKKSSAELLAKYLAHFYDDKLVIQDQWFLQDEKNRANFESYILPYVDQATCTIELKVMVNRELAQIGSQQKRLYEGKKGYRIKVHCIDQAKENLHEGYFESSKYRMNLGYRLFVFGTKGENLPDTISIFKK